MLRKFALLLILISSSFNIQASHLIGGDITWECTGNNSYIFTLTLYRDCSGANLPTGNQTISGPTGNIVCTYNPSLSSVISSLPNSTNCLTEKGVYRSNPVNLPSTPPPAGFEFYYSGCCRPVTENTNSSNFYLRSKMYPYTNPGAGSPTNINSCFDNSPQFLNNLSFINTNGKFSFNHQVIDVDQDSLSISFAQPFENAFQPISFSIGFSSLAPFPDSTENALNGPNLINTNSGILSIETYNAISGYYANCVVARSFRNGQLIAEVYRELPLYIHNLPSSTVNNPPNLEIDTAFFTKVRRTGNTYRLTAMNNDSIDLNFDVSDFDLNGNGTIQSFCLSANGSKINPQNLMTDTACVGGGPCATIDTIGSGGYCGNLVKTFKFKWLAQCSLLSAGLKGRTSYIFHISARDNDSILPKSGHLTLIIDLFPSQSNAPSFSINSGNTAGDIDFVWNKTNGQSDSPFQRYQIYGNSGPGTAFFLLDSISDPTKTSKSFSGLNFPAEFYLNQVTGSCRATSTNSDTVNSSIILSMDEFSDAGLYLYPQPAKEFLILENTLNLEELQSANLYNSNGNLVQGFPIDPNASKQKLMLSIGTGLYILDIQIADKHIRKKVIIKK